ncbi:MAM protein, partial [Lutibacter aestuarii]
VGRPNNGDIELTVSGDNDYLIGNPYPSAIDANQFILDNKTSITGTLYFWDHYGGDSHYLLDYQAGFATYNLSGGIGIGTAAEVHPINDPTAPDGTKVPERYIAVGQGFFIQGAGGASQTIEFNNNQRIFQTEGSGNSIFMRPSKTATSKDVSNGDTRTKFRIGFSTSEIHKQLLLTIDENASDEVDYGYDAKIYEITPEDMYWLIDDEKFVIQGTNTISNDKEFPIGLELSKKSKISIHIDRLENNEQFDKLYIKDASTGETFEITNQPFEIELEAGIYSDRFKLVFQPRLKRLDEISLEKG